MIIEDDGKDFEHTDWSRIEQESKALNGERSVSHHSSDTHAKYTSVSYNDNCGCGIMYRV